MRIAPARGSAIASTRANVAPVALHDVDEAQLVRIGSGMREFDALLGGGIVPGSLTLIGGPPGAGKSTLLLQVAAACCGGPVVYVCGEESAAQVKLRAARLQLPSRARGLLLLAETNLREALEQVERTAPAAIVIDSIQTAWVPESESYAGSVTQIRDCTQMLMQFAKRTGCAVFIVGHVTKDGAIAGPRALEHLVDTVLYFEGEAGGEHRIVRAYKNRFGSVDEICVLTMRADGLHEVANPSELFLSGMKDRTAAASSGTCVTAGFVGSRPVLLEIQALVGEATYATPRRLANNLDQARMSMIIAVLERRAGMQLGSHDVYASAAGGLRVIEPAADLAVALAIASSFRNRPLPPRSAAFGELGLTGEVRAVNAASRRIAEAGKLGFGTLFTPQNCPDIAAAIDLALA